jgi:mRNA interferase MazF
MWKTRPVVVVSRFRDLYGTCAVLPVTTQDPGNNPWAYPFSISLSGHRNWVLCNLISTVAVSRLSADRSGIPRVPQEEFGQILARLRAWLPSVQEIAE